MYIYFLYIQMSFLFIKWRD